MLNPLFKPPKKTIIIKIRSYNVISHPTQLLWPTTCWFESDNDVFVVDHITSLKIRMFYSIFFSSPFLLWLLIWITHFNLLYYNGFFHRPSSLSSFQLTTTTKKPPLYTIFFKPNVMTCFLYREFLFIKIFFFVLFCLSHDNYNDINDDNNHIDKLSIEIIYSWYHHHHHLVVIIVLYNVSFIVIMMMIIITKNEKKRNNME